MLNIITSNVKCCALFQEKFRDVGVEFNLLFLSSLDKQLKDNLIALQSSTADIIIIGESFFF